MKKEIESRSRSGASLSAEPSAELVLSGAANIGGFDVLINDEYVGSITAKSSMIKIKEIPEGIVTLKFISFNFKNTYEKQYELKGGGSYMVKFHYFHPNSTSPSKYIQKKLDEQGAMQVKGSKGSIYLSFEQGRLQQESSSAIVHSDLSSITFPYAGPFGATSSYFYVETTTKGFSKKHGYVYNQSFGARQPFLKYPNSGVIWGMETNLWMSEDVFPDGTGYYSGIPTTISLNYILGYQIEFLDFLILYSTGSMGPALKETTVVTSGTGINVTTKSEWGVTYDSSADVGLIVTFGPKSRAGISLESNYNSHTGQSFAIGFIFAKTKILKRNTLY